MYMFSLSLSLSLSLSPHIILVSSLAIDMFVSVSDAWLWLHPLAHYSVISQSPPLPLVTSPVGGASNPSLTAPHSTLRGASPPSSGPAIATASPRPVPTYHLAPVAVASLLL